MLFFNNFPQNVSSFLAEAPIFQHSSMPSGNSYTPTLMDYRDARKDGLAHAFSLSILFYLHSAHQVTKNLRNKEPAVTMSESTTASAWEK